jgi:hypothetical protein
MEIRMKIGRYAGQIRDIRNDVARALLAKGAATDPQRENRRVRQAVAATAEALVNRVDGPPTPQPVKPGKLKAKKLKKAKKDKRR